MSASREPGDGGDGSVRSGGGGATTLAGLSGRLLVLVLVALVAGCSMAGFGSSLELNITDLQTRRLTIRVQAPEGARIVETRTSGEVELGTGSATIERYVLQRATFGRGVATGLFLCEAECTRPLETFVVANSTEQLFSPTGELRLQFRIETDSGPEELSRIVTPGMLEELWTEPELQVSLR